MPRLLVVIVCAVMFVMISAKKTAKINKVHALMEIEEEPFIFTIDRSNCPVSVGLPGCVCYSSDSSVTGTDYGCGSNNGFICTKSRKAQYYVYSSGEVVSVDTAEFHQSMPFLVKMREVEDGEEVPFLSIGKNDECSIITAKYLYPAGENSALDNNGECEACEC